MPPVGYEPTISAGERPQTYTLDHTATGTLFSITLSQCYFVIVRVQFHTQVRQQAKLW